MDVLILIAVVFLALYIAAKILWRAGFYAGRDHEAVMWIDSINKLFPPNWQSYPLKDKDLDPEELKFANQVYAAAYRAAVDHIKIDIAEIRRESLQKFQAEQEAERPA